MLLLRAALFCALAVFLALPETVRAHSENAIAEASMSDRAHGASHDAHGVEISGHCHPGLDCFVSAVFSVQPMIKSSGAEARAIFAFVKHESQSWRPLFEPPPPRNLS